MFTLPLFDPSTRSRIFKEDVIRIGLEFLTYRPIHFIFSWKHVLLLNTRNASLSRLNPLQNSKIQFQTFTLCTQIEHSNHNRTTIVPQINLKSISNLSKNAVSSIIKSFDTLPSISSPILSPSNGSPVEQSTKRITLWPFESWPGELRRTEAISRHRLRSQSCSYLLEIPLGWAASRSAIFRAVRKRKTACRRNFPASLRATYVRISNEGSFPGTR